MDPETQAIRRNPLPNSLRVLLLNPPAPKTIQRDHYCSLSTKADSYWPPIDLVMQSGILSLEHQVSVLDAVVEQSPADDVLREVIRRQPQVVVALSSVLTAKDDLAFLDKVKKATGARIVLMGDIYYFRPELMIQAGAVDAICLQQATPALLDYLAGDDAPEDMVCKAKNGDIHFGKKLKGPLKIPEPRQELFLLDKYRFPMSRHKLFAPVLTMTGCPKQCSYCPVSSVDYRPRSIESVLAELSSLSALGIKEILLMDLMFNADSKRAKQLCKSVIDSGLKLSWTTLLRPEKLDPELVTLLKEAGCHTVLCGVETVDPEILKKNRRELDLGELSKSFDMLHQAGLKSLAFVILGLPGESWSSALQTIRFVCSLPCDYLSVNLFVPRCGSSYMKPYQTLDDVLEYQADMDSTTTQTSHCSLSGLQLIWLKRWALARFYLRPKLLWRHLRSLNSWNQLFNIVRIGPRLVFRD